MLDGSGYPKFLLDALALAYLLLQTLLRHLCEAATLALLLGDPAPHYAVYGDRRHLQLLTGGH